MVKTLLTGACLMALLAGCASGPQNRTASVNAADRSCPPGATKVTQCSAGMVRSYSGEELRRTGMVDVGHALQMLDPEITTGH